MIAFGLDSTGDLDLNPNTGAFNMVEDDDEIADPAQTRGSSKHSKVHVGLPSSSLL